MVNMRTAGEPRTLLQFLLCPCLVLAITVNEIALIPALRTLCLPHFSLIIWPFESHCLWKRLVWSGWRGQDRSVAEEIQLRKFKVVRVIVFISRLDFLAECGVFEQAVRNSRSGTPHLAKPDGIETRVQHRYEHLSI